MLCNKLMYYEEFIKKKDRELKKKIKEIEEVSLRATIR